MAYNWNGLADLLADLIEKHIDELDLDTLPEPLRYGTFALEKSVKNEEPDLETELAA